MQTLLKDAGALEHRLVNTQEERDAAVSRSSELEQELARLGAGNTEAATAAAEAASKIEELQKQVETLLESSGAVEHRLVNTQQERDAAVTCSSELEQDLVRVGAGTEEAATAAVEAAETKAASKIAEAEARCAASVDTLKEEMTEEKTRLQEAATEQQQALQQAVKESEELRSEVNGLREAAEEAGAGTKEELDEARAELEQVRARIAAAEQEVDRAARDKVSSVELDWLCCGKVLY